MKNSCAFCSQTFLKGVKWLEKELKFDEERLRLDLEKWKSKIDEAESKRDTFSVSTFEWAMRDISDRLRLRYRAYDAEEIYILGKTQSSLIDEFLKAAENEAFWEDGWTFFVENVHLLWFLKQIDVKDNKRLVEVIDIVIKDQTVEGYIQSNEIDHTGPLRVLVALKPNSVALSNAVGYWLNNWKKMVPHLPRVTAVGVLALTELDYERYHDNIIEQVDYLKKLQRKDGSWGFDGEPDIKDTGYAIWAIARAAGTDDPSAKKGLEWLMKQQQGNGSWKNYTSDTALALIGLLAMGEGPKIPYEHMENSLMKLHQKLLRQRPIFLHTSPPAAKEIYDKILDMLPRAKKEIRVASPFIDMLYEEIAKAKQNNPNLGVKIISRPKKETGGPRERIAKGAIDELNRVTRGGVIESELIHARVVIVDENEALISSADLTRDQLIDEFNAGVWTCDKEVVRNAIDFFDNMFQLEKERREENPIA
mgnify:CR=1 FL=1